MGDFCRRNKESVVTRNPNGDLAVKVFTYGDVQRQMRLIDALVDVSEHFVMSDVKGRCLVVKTVKKDTVLERLLQKELFPPIRCRVHVFMWMDSHLGHLFESPPIRYPILVCEEG